MSRTKITQINCFKSSRETLVVRHQLIKSRYSSKKKYEDADDAGKLDQGFEHLLIYVLIYTYNNGISSSLSTTLSIQYFDWIAKRLEIKLKCVSSYIQLNRIGKYITKRYHICVFYVEKELLREKSRIVNCFYGKTFMR